MAIELIITDPVYTKKETKSRFDDYVLEYIRDERDLPFVYLMLKLSLTVVPAALFQFIPGRFNWFFAMGYLVAIWILFMGPYILMLHCTSHRPLFKREYEHLNLIIPWLLGPFFGETPETYYSHHLGMHHPENNLKEDLSSTMAYQRDSFIGYMHYFLKFFLKVIPDLYRYLTDRKRFKLRKRVLVGESCWYFSVILLASFNWRATLAVFVIPMCFTRFMMMAGNWGQHAFIDADAPANCYRNSITCINSLYNHMCFNDGYHIGHHLQPTMHYTDMPVEFQNNLATYAKEHAIVFEGIDFFVVWLLLMTKNYKYLASKFVRLDDRLPTEADVVAFLKSRVQRVPTDKMI